MENNKSKIKRKAQNGIIRTSKYRNNNERFDKTYYVPYAKPTRKLRHISGRKNSPATIANFLVRKITDETVGGIVLIIVAAIAIILANSQYSSDYFQFIHTKIGPESLHLNLPLSHWASDGILTIFFFVVGLELKTEFVTGALRDFREASLPMLAAVFGMVGPALCYVFVQLGMGSPETLHGWAIPTATDIAFAVAILGIFGKGMPPTVRTFLLTLAVVDDLLAIIVIAVFYSTKLNFLSLAISLLLISVFAILVQKRIIKPYLLFPLAILSWYFMHSSGIHATIAGVALGLVVPATYDNRLGHQLTHHWASKFNIVSAGFALPVFAFFTAGVSIGSGGIAQALTDPVTIGVALGLPLGKCIGIWGSVYILTKTTRLKLGNGVDLADVFAISLLSGIGFTVALLVSGLAFGQSILHIDHAKLAVLIGTLLSCALGAIALRFRLSQHNRGPNYTRHKILHH